MRGALVLFILCVIPATARAEDEALRKAVERGLKRLEAGAANYTKNRQCFSCHHQALSMIAFATAPGRGFTVEADKLKAQTEFTLKTFKNHDKIAKGQTVGGANTTVAYALFALEGVRHPADATTAALIEFLLVRQKADGSWPATTLRPPSEGSKFTSTALALRVLRYYGPAKDAKDAEALRKRIDAAFEKGRDWLLENKPVDTEDKLWRLRGLVSASVDRKEIDTARDLLLKEQLADGSWAQLPDKKAGDAYATGAVLMALRHAGVKADAEEFAKGIRYLLKTQRDDGAWLVETRSKPVQIFFDNGDPGGKSQFISFAATGWAVQALLEACAEK